MKQVLNFKTKEELIEFRGRVIELLGDYYRVDQKKGGEKNEVNNMQSVQQKREEMVKEQKRKIVAPFDITKLKRCPYCSTTDIDYDPIMKNWRCNVCDEIWED